MNIAWLGLVHYRLNLVTIHCHAGCGDDMTEIGHGCLARQALGALEDEVMLAEEMENSTDMVKVLCS